ncbi:MAG: RNA polymerase sigma factor [Anaerolineae bacterium]
MDTRVNTRGREERSTGPSGERGASTPALDDVGDAVLVERVRGGETAAFAGLYARHHVALYRTALAMTGHPSRAEELVQDTFLRAYRHLGQVVLAPDASLRPWLHRILVHLIYDDSARRAHPSQPIESMDERLPVPNQASVERRIEARELRRAVSGAIERLPVRHREVVVLFYLDDLDVGEIADMLGVPPGTVKSRLFYGRARLRELLAAEAPEASARLGALEAARAATG